MIPAALSWRRPFPTRRKRVWETLIMASVAWSGLILIVYLVFVAIGGGK